MNAMPIEHATKARKWGPWSPCWSLQNRLDSWRLEQQTNRYRFAYFAPSAIQAIEAKMRAYDC